jgi:hypothetical protein
MRELPPEMTFGMLSQSKPRRRERLVGEGLVPVRGEPRLDEEDKRMTTFLDVKIHYSSLY